MTSTHTDYDQHREGCRSTSTIAITILVVSSAPATVAPGKPPPRNTTQPNPTHAPPQVPVELSLLEQMSARTDLFPLGLARLDWSIGLMEYKYTGKPVEYKVCGGGGGRGVGRAFALSILPDATSPPLRARLRRRACIW